MKLRNKFNKIRRINSEILSKAVQNAKVHFNYSLNDNDEIVAVDEETPFIVLIKNSERRFLWAIDFLLSEHVRNFDRIPRIKVSEHLKVWRCL